jgi:hypothetical protein
LDLGAFSRVVAAILALLAAASTLPAQSTLDSGCAAPEHRQFDFWVGNWTVHDSTGRLLGTSEVVRIAGGCGLREHWRSAGGGGEGMSLNVWQPALGAWTQFWVGAGAALRLTGKLEPDGAMVLSGDRTTPDGTVRDRITWRLVGSGNIRQTWRVSRDGGNSWSVVFDGIYRRVTVRQ